ncbi:MAG: hypothetical protein K6G30_13515 [Acetatifactor sp.]|nr:hypothetical protein [Acetatifactor sp.]
MRFILNSKEMVMSDSAVNDFIANYPQTMQITFLEPGEVHLSKTDHPVLLSYTPNTHPLQSAIRRERRLLFEQPEVNEEKRFKIVVGGDAVVDVSGHVEVEVMDKAVVNSYGHAKITVRDTARVRATVDDEVEAFDNATVVAKSNAVVCLHDSATAKLSQNARLQTA